MAADIYKISDDMRCVLLNDPSNSDPALQYKITIIKAGQLQEQMFIGEQQYEDLKKALNAFRAGNDKQYIQNVIALLGPGSSSSKIANHLSQESGLGPVKIEDVQLENRQDQFKN